MGYKKNITSATANYVFTECAYWTITHDFKWYLFENPVNEWNEINLTNLLHLEKDLGYVYLHNDNDKFLLIALDYRHPIKEFEELVQEKMTSNSWHIILNKIEQTVWCDVDFNKTSLVWDVVHQQCASPFIDLVANGIVCNAPKTWHCTPRSKDWKRVEEEKSKHFKKNYQNFKIWCEHFKKEDLEPSFLDWYETKHFSKKNGILKKILDILGGV